MKEECEACGKTDVFILNGLCEICARSLEKAWDEWEMSKQTATTIKWCKKILKKLDKIERKIK